MGGFIFALIVIVIAIPLIIYVTNDNNTSTDESPEPANNSRFGQEMDVVFKETPSPDGEPLAKFSCSIAGLPYHQDNIILGGFVGYAVHEKDNPYDNLAIAIFNIHGGLMGYVPAKAHNEYLAFFPDKVPCYVVGYIDVTSDSRFVSKVYLIRIHSWRYAKVEIESLCRWLSVKRRYTSIDGLDETIDRLNSFLQPDELNHNTEALDVE